MFLWAGQKKPHRSVLPPTYGKLGVLPIGLSSSA